MNSARKTFDDNRELIDYLQDFIKQNDGLDYNAGILRSVYFGLHTRQLIVLTGRPGTGKTSLVRALARAFSSENAAIIAVQSNWTDRGDLLGYYNPIERRYVSTPFLDALLKFRRAAIDDPNSIYFICLDEMNLAHVEYYFAEFLSALQSETPTIELYSPSLARDVADEIELFNQHSQIDVSGETIKYYAEIRRLQRMLEEYPQSFDIPHNIKFFGTLNQDGTTLDISPKVRDRSFFVRIDEQFDVKVFGDFDEPPQFIRHKGRRDTVNLLPSVEQWANKLGVTLSRRLARVITDIADGDNNGVDNKFTIGAMVDSLIAALLLPKIECTRDEEQFRRLEGVSFDGMPISKRIFETMRGDDEISYWRQ